MVNLKLFLIGVAAILILGLGALFIVGETTISKNTNKNSSEEGIVAGETTIEQDNDYITRLAKEISSKGLILYGSYRSEDSKNQLNLFGDASKYIDYVECDTSGRDANPDECLSQKIDSYPTWIYEGQQYHGVQTLGELAKIIQFRE